MGRSRQILTIIALMFLILISTVSSSSAILPLTPLKRKGISKEGIVFEGEAEWGKVEVIVKREVLKYFEISIFKPRIFPLKKNHSAGVKMSVRLKRGPWQFLEVKFYKKAFFTGSRKRIRAWRKQAVDYKFVLHPVDGIAFDKQYDSGSLETEEPWDLAVLDYNDSVEIIRYKSVGGGTTRNEAFNQACKRVLPRAILRCADPSGWPTSPDFIKKLLPEAENYIRDYYGGWNNIRGGLEFVFYFDAALIRNALLQQGISVATRDSMVARAKLCQSELGDLVYPENFATFDFDIEVSEERLSLEQVISKNCDYPETYYRYTAEKWARFYLRNVKTMVKQDKMKLLIKWLKEFLVTDNEYLLNVLCEHNIPLPRQLNDRLRFRGDRWHEMRDCFQRMLPSLTVVFSDKEHNPLFRAYPPEWRRSEGSYAPRVMKSETVYGDLYLITDIYPIGDIMWYGVPLDILQKAEFVRLQASFRYGTCHD